VADAGTFAGIIQNGISTTAVQKDGTGTLALTGANTFSGGVNLTGGTLSLDNNAALGTGALDMGAGTTLDLGTNGLAVGNNIALAGAASLNTNAGISGTVTGIISGGGSLDKTGDGTLVLTGVNTYSGGTTINGGTLVAGHHNGAEHRRDHAGGQRDGADAQRQRDLQQSTQRRRRT